MQSPKAQKTGKNFLFSYCGTNQAVHCFSARPHFVDAIQAGTAAYADFHWDPSGHRAVAEALFDFLVNVNHFVSP